MNQAEALVIPGSAGRLRPSRREQRAWWRRWIELWKKLRGRRGARTA